MEGMCLEVKSLSEALAEYDDGFLLGAYRELVYLRKTGSFPINQQYFRELCGLRYKLFEDRSIDNAKRDLLDEIARRWALIVEGEKIND